MTTARRAAIERILGELRSPSEGLLPTASYAALLEAFIATRERTGRPMTEDEFYGIVEWADLAALRSQWVEGLIAGTLGLDLVDAEPALCAPAGPADRAAAAAALPVLDDDLASASVVAAFAAVRHGEGRPALPAELAIVRAWAAAAVADRALLDLALGYGALGLDINPDGRVVLVGAGAPV